MRARQSNNPKRRIGPPNFLNDERKRRLLETGQYVGSGVHKRSPANYGFRPPVSPRPHKSLCDDLRPIPLEEARALFATGVEKGMVSTTCNEDNLPKYVWSVDAHGEVYEAKSGNGGYHGYRLNQENELEMRNLVLKEWNRR